MRSFDERGTGEILVAAVAHDEVELIGVGVTVVLDQRSDEGQDGGPVVKLPVVEPRANVPQTIRHGRGVLPARLSHPTSMTWSVR
jgi:hypothetical protein